MGQSAAAKAGAVGATQPEQVILYGAVATQDREEPVSRLAIDKPIGVKRTDVDRVERLVPTEHQSQKWIGGKRRCFGRTKQADVDTGTKAGEEIEKSVVAERSWHGNSRSTLPSRITLPE